MLLCISLEEEPRPCLNHFSIVSWLLLFCLCIPFLLWWATVWIYPLEFREDLGRSRRPKTDSYKQEGREDRNNLYLGGSCLVSIYNSTIFLTLSPWLLYAVLVAQSHPTLSRPHELPGSFVHGIFQARILEWVVISSSRGSPGPRDLTLNSCIGRWILYHWATWEALGFFYFWLLLRLSLVTVRAGSSLVGCTGFSLRWLLSLQSTGSRSSGSVVVAHRP